MGAASGAHKCYCADGRPHGFSRSLWEAPDALERAIARVPLGRVGEAEDVAGLALLLPPRRAPSSTVRLSLWMAELAPGNDEALEVADELVLQNQVQLVTQSSDAFFIV